MLILLLGISAISFALSVAPYLFGWNFTLPFLLGLAEFGVDVSCHTPYLGALFIGFAAASVPCSFWRACVRADRHGRAWFSWQSARHRAETNRLRWDQDPINRPWEDEIPICCRYLGEIYRNILIILAPRVGLQVERKYLVHIAISIRFD
jgi:hypothetical protein